VAAFAIVFGTLGYGLILPTKIDPNSSSVPAPPAVTYLSPIMPLIAIATNAPPLTNYFVRYDYQNGAGYSSAAVMCKGNVCSSGGPAYTTSGKGGSGVASTTEIPSGLFKGWQYWQATVGIQLTISLIALLLSAVLLPPVRRLPWRRRRPAVEPT
jgi:hypothetical protein